MTQTAPGATRKRPAAAATIPVLEARVADLRAHVEKTTTEKQKAEQWHDSQGTRASFENRREARYEHTLAVNGLRRAEQELAAARRQGGVAS